MRRRTALLAGLALAAPGRAAAPAVLEVGGSRLVLVFDDTLAPGLRAAVPDWLAAAAQAVAGYFGRFPVPAAEIAVVAADGPGVRHGRTRPGPPPRLQLALAPDTDPAWLRDDWIAVHEMVHLAVPRLAIAHNWLHEGIATYVEGVARARAGLTAPRRLWIELAQQLPQGQPRPGDGGLDDSPTWARTYWGGTLFCLLADVRLRERGAAGGLQQALQGLLAAGGSYAVAWDIRRVLATADAAVGQTTLGELYAQMKDTPVRIDLDALWARLGVDGTRLREDAPLAALRRAITAADAPR
ncbi:MAG: hypothetical protein KIT35_24185 [Piscinibacter sp.]|uniref:hypothetical protein n=1 Tax=Piscinibacter sp. TaxID=1903157 RepID=UPI00258A48A4|nr:hypothetical protein [Piscinibacter sp.]MCW5666947.1 hypothetical protein [Piscinibacter sp.]